MLNNEVIENVSKKVFDNYPDYRPMFSLCRDIERLHLYTMYTSDGLKELKRIIFRQMNQDFNLNFLKDVYDMFIFEGSTPEELLKYAEDTYWLLKEDSQLKRVYILFLPEVTQGVPREQEFLSIYDTIFVQIVLLRKIALNIIKLCQTKMASEQEAQAEKKHQMDIEKQKEATLESLGIKIGKGINNENIRESARLGQLISTGKE